MPSAPATLKRIAEQLGVSVTTVSRALSGQSQRYRISRKTESAVKKLAAELHFSPNSLARGLRLKKTLTIGLVVPTIANPSFYAAIANEVVAEARKREYSVLLCYTQDDTAIEIASIDALRSRSVDGLVLCPVGQTDQHLRQFEDGGLPVVLLDRCFPKLRLPYVTSNNYLGAREATQYLIANGHRRIACVQGLRGTYANDERFRGYRQALDDCHIAWDPGFAVGQQFDEQDAYLESKVLLRRKSDVTAIFAFSNQIALGVLRALADEGRRVPQDVSVLCFDDDPAFSYLAPPLTAVAQSGTELGQVAVKLLFQWISDRSQPPREGILLPTTLVKRQSVATVAGE
jgi:LacI family transcriptional regulator